MTRFEYLQLRDLIKSSLQKETSGLLIVICTITFLMTCLFYFILFLPFIIPFDLGVRTWGNFTSCLINIPLLLPALFIALVIHIIVLDKIYFKYNLYFKKLGEAWKEEKSVEETLALPEFAKLFPEKSSLPPGPIGLENEI